MADANIPTTLVYNKLWEMLEASPSFTSMVKPGNRVTFTGVNRDPIKPEVATADLPEVRLVPIGTLPHLLNTSNSSFLTKMFAVQAATGDQRTQYADAGNPTGLFPLEWAVYRALAPWKTVLLTLLWEGKPFVHGAKYTDSSDSLVDINLERSIKGWTTVWACEIEMNFASADL